MKTLAVYHKQLGDTLLLQPALARLAAQDGQPVGLITRPGFADLVSLMPGVQFVGWQEAPRTERLLCYEAGDRSVFVSLWCRARHKTLLTFSSHYQKFYHSWIFNHIHLEEQEQKYRARYQWDITPGTQADEFQPPLLNTPPADWTHPDLPQSPFILVHATSAWKRKCWPAQTWQEVITHLRTQSALPIVLTGGTSDWERDLCAEIAASNPGVLNLGGKTTLRQIISIVSQSNMVFCVDGFVSHVAMAYRKPCITIFGPTNVNHWHLDTPWSAAVQGRPAQGKPQMSDVSAPAMFPHLGRLLEQSKIGLSTEH